MLYKAIPISLKDIRERLGIDLSEGTMREWLVEVGIEGVKGVLWQIYRSQEWLAEKAGLRDGKVVSGEPSVEYKYMEGLAEEKKLTITFLKLKFGNVLLPLAMGIYLQGGNGKLWEGLSQSAAFDSGRSAVIEKLRASGVSEKELKKLKPIDIFNNNENILNFLDGLRRVYRKAVLGEGGELSGDEISKLVEGHLLKVFPSPLVRRHIEVVARDMLGLILIGPQGAWEGVAGAASAFKAAGRSVSLLLDDENLWRLFRVVSSEEIPLEKVLEDMDLLRKFVSLAALLAHYTNRIGGTPDTSIFHSLQEHQIEPQFGSGSYLPLLVEIANKTGVPSTTDDPLFPLFGLVVRNVLGSVSGFSLIGNKGLGARLIAEAASMMGYDVPEEVVEATRRGITFKSFSHALVDLHNILSLLADKSSKKELRVNSKEMPNLTALLKGMNLPVRSEVKGGEQIEVIVVGPARSSIIRNKADELGALISSYTVSSRRKGKYLDNNRLIEEYGLVLDSLSEIVGEDFIGEAWMDFYRFVNGALVEAILYFADPVGGEVAEGKAPRWGVHTLLGNFFNQLRNHLSHTGAVRTGLFSAGEGDPRSELRELLLKFVGDIPPEKRAEVAREFIERMVGRKGTEGREGAKGQEGTEGLLPFLRTALTVSSGGGKRAVRSLLGLSVDKWEGLLSEWSKHLGDEDYLSNTVFSTVRGLIEKWWKAEVPHLVGSMRTRLENPQIWVLIMRSLFAPWVGEGGAGVEEVPLSSLQGEEGRPIEEVLAGAEETVDDWVNALYKIVFDLANTYQGNIDLFREKRREIRSGFAFYFSAREEEGKEEFMGILQEIISGKTPYAIKVRSVLGDVWVNFVRELVGLLSGSEFVAALKAAGEEVEADEWQELWKPLKERVERISETAKPEVPEVVGSEEVLELEPPEGLQPELTEEGEGKPPEEGPELTEEEGGRTLIKFRLLSWLSS